MHELIATQTNALSRSVDHWLTYPMIATLKKEKIKETYVKLSGAIFVCSSTMRLTEIGMLWVPGQPNYKARSYLKNKAVKIAFSWAKYYLESLDMERNEIQALLAH